MFQKEITRADIVEDRRQPSIIDQQNQAKHGPIINLRGFIEFGRVTNPTYWLQSEDEVPKSVISNKTVARNLPYRNYNAGPLLYICSL